MISLFGGILLGQKSTELKILKVDVTGNELTTRNMILYTSGLHDGTTLKSGDLSRSTKRLWQLGLFSDIQIYLTEETPEGISIVISVVENPILGNLVFKGNKKIKEGKLKEKLGLQPGQRLRPHLSTEAVQKIKKLYAEDGYLRVNISTEYVETSAKNLPSEKVRINTRDLVFNIEEGKKIKLKQIEFVGNDAYPQWRLRYLLKETKQQRWYFFWRSFYDTDKFEEDKQLLTSFYKNNGYRDFEIVSDSVKYNDNAMNLVVTLKEGPKYRFRNFSWEGQTLYTSEQLKKRLGLSKGDVYNEEEFNKAVFDRMQGLYMDKGYIYSQIEPKINPIGEDSIDVHFQVTENHMVTVRNILISGNTKTRENVIRRELKIYPGDVFNRNRLIRSQQDVWMLNYFGNVVPEVIPVDEDEIDLEIMVEEKSSDRASANIGFTGEYGMTGGGGLEFNNFRGLGQRFSLSFNTGTNYSMYQTTTPSKYRSFSLSFTDPMIFDTPNLVGASLFYSFRGASTNYSFPLDITIRGGSISLGRRFRWPDDYFRGNWIFRAVKKTYSGDPEDIADFNLEDNETTTGINLTQVITRDSRDRPEFTTMGSRVSLETTMSGWFLGGNEDFHKHLLNLEWYTPTFWKFVLMGSAKLGVISPLPSLDDKLSLVPFDEKFIMGGNGIPYGNMLRGYPDNSIGPITSSGQPAGGNAMMRFTTEYRVPFSESPVVYGMLFGEMGNVWNTSDLTEPFNLPRAGALSLKRTAGAGVRFYMPMIGMLGFDLGYGFDDINGDGNPQGWTYTITFGQPF